MPFAVELFLRDDESQAIRRLFTATGSLLADIGTTPHLSLAIVEHADLPALIAIVRAFAARTAPFRLRLSSIALFPGPTNVIFLAPVVSRALLELHADLHAQLASHALSSHPYYLPDQWVPHCAIAVDEPPGRSPDTIRTIQAADVLGDYTIDNVHVVEFRPVVVWASYRLAGVPQL